jgi:hypothetical protein
LIVGSVPGMPVQISQTAVLGSDVVGSTTLQPQNIFDCVNSSACISRPITGSYSDIKSFPSFLISIEEIESRFLYVAQTIIHAAA